MKSNWGRYLRQQDWTLIAVYAATCLALGVFGSLIWILNGSFSVLGLETFSAAQNSPTQLFWAQASAWRFSTPVAVPGLPRTQPVIPWLGVAAASILQVLIPFRHFKKKPTPLILQAIAVILCIYDVGSTWIGLGTLSWIVGVGIIGHFFATIFITFCIELTILLILLRR